MSEFVPLTNAVAAMMIRSVLSGHGGEDGLFPAALTLAPPAADAVVIAAMAEADASPEAAAMVNDQAAPAAESPAGARTASSANGRSGEHHSARWLRAAV